MRLRARRYHYRYPAGEFDVRAISSKVNIALQPRDGRVLDVGSFGPHGVTQLTGASGDSVERVSPKGSGMKQIARSSVVDAVVEQLRARIHSGKWPVGSKIPTEVKLVEMLGVSRPSVREAVRSLVQLGLLETRQGDGTYVMAKDELKGVLQDAISAAANDEVTSIRRSLDLLAVAQAARRRSDDDVIELRAALAGRRQAVHDGDMEAFVDHDLRFHFGIVHASGNSLLRNIYQSFEGAQRDALRQSNTPAVIDDPQGELHAQVLAAIERGDAAAAVAATGGLLDSRQSHDSGSAAG